MALLNLYRQEDTTACRLSVQFLGEEGDDFGGLTKEMFTIFWRSVAEELLCGEHRVVPRLPLRRSVEIRVAGKDSFAYSGPHRNVASYVVNIYAAQRNLWNRRCRGVFVRGLPPIHHRSGKRSPPQGYGLIRLLDWGWAEPIAALLHCAQILWLSSPSWNKRSDPCYCRGGVG